MDERMRVKHPWRGNIFVFSAILSVEKYYCYLLSVIKREIMFIYVYWLHIYDLNVAYAMFWVLLQVHIQLT